MVKRKARLARFPAEWRGLGGVFAGPPRGQRRRGKVKLAGQRGHSVLNCLPVHVSARPLRSQFSDGSKAQGVAPQLLGADVEEEPADVLLKLWPEIVNGRLPLPTEPRALSQAGAGVRPVPGFPAALRASRP